MPLISRHIALELLADRAEGKRLDPDQVSEIERHLSGCDRCTEQARTFDAFFAHLDRRSLEAPPTDATRNALRIFTAGGHAVHVPFTQRLRGILAFDDWDPAFAVNERSALSDSRQLLYRSADHDLDIRLAPVGDNWTVAGQLMGDCTGGRVSLRSGSYLAETPMNDVCEFSFAQVPAGTFSLEVSFDGNVFEVESFVIE